MFNISKANVIIITLFILMVAGHMLYAILAMDELFVNFTFLVLNQ
jgi:hypothetical protein